MGLASLAKAPSAGEDCVYKVIIPRILVPCEEPTALQDRLLKHWREPEVCKATDSTANDITARMDEVLVSSEDNAPPKKCLQLKFRNVNRVCASAEIFSEFQSTTVVNTRTKELGMVLMCIMAENDDHNVERWMRYDRVCPHAALIDMRLPSEYTTFSTLYEPEQATAIEDELYAALITDQSKDRRPMNLRIAVSKQGKRQLLISGLEHFDLSSATTRLRAVLTSEGKLDMLHTLVYNLVFEETSCAMHLFVSQVSTLNDQGDALCDVLLSHHLKTCVGHLNVDMQIVPFNESDDPNTSVVPYKQCTVQFPIPIPNPVNIGANLYNFIARKVFRRGRPASQHNRQRASPYGKGRGGGSNNSRATPAAMRGSRDYD